jgi:hypothetical protein
VRRGARIYPVPLKPASSILSWDGWPEDVVERLRHWNGGHRGLSFGGGRVFKCPDCARFCEPQRYGTATISGVEICDDCLIERARRANAKAATIVLGRPPECGSCICGVERIQRRDFRPECTYHAAALAHPDNHSIPWNCPTYWDGCNCTLPQHNAPEAVA